MMGRLLLLAATALLLSACGLKPLYTGGTNGAVAQELGAVSIAPIEGRAGWLVRGALEDRFGALARGTPRYRLDVALDDRITGLGLLANDTVTRERRTLRARYQLIDMATGETVLDATASSDAGIDVVSSEYATIAAESRALENLSLEIANQIVTRVSLFARDTSAAP